MRLQIYYYAGVFGLSLLLTLLYVYRWKKQFQIHMTAIFLLIPIVNFGYLSIYLSHVPETAAAMLKITYIGGCFLPWLITMCELSLCQIEVSRPVRMGALLASTTVFLSALTIGYSPLFYQSLTLERVGAVWIQHKVYGPFHTLHYVCIILYLITDLAVILYSYRHRKQVSRRILLLLCIPILISAISYGANRYLSHTGYDPIPLAFTIAQILYLMIVRRMAFYNVSIMVIESMAQSGDTGFVTIDSDGRYLGSNETARRILPALEQVRVDQRIRECASLQDSVHMWLDAFQKTPDACKFVYTPPVSDAHIYAVTVSYLYDGSTLCGYQIFLQDDTQNQKYIRLLDQYNNDLQAQVAAKTERLIAMHDRLILGMAAMVESRDNSTGGHIRRTSEDMRILVDTIRAVGTLSLSESYCQKLIKAAPMHDLGKIAVDDAVLRKPGRFTPAEYEKMKAHAAEGARIVHEILADTEDEDFRRIAENMAHYHHERYDGSGYPEGLRGEAIPLEARIMAIVDVYDALVSRRVYKDAFSFERANQILLEGMGTQFDPMLEPYYTASRPKLEAYYRQAI